MAANNRQGVPFFKSPTFLWGFLATVCFVCAWVFFKQTKKIAVDDPNAKVKKISLWTAFIAVIFGFFMSVYMTVRPKASNGNGNFAAAVAIAAEQHSAQNAAARSTGIMAGSQTTRPLV
jgi:hypothetical protein